jgi:hypothetical protein
MDELRDPTDPPPRLTALTDAFADADGNEDWLADPDSAREADGNVPHVPATDGRPRGWRQIARGRKRLLPIGVAVIVVIAASIVLVSQLGGTTKAFADPTKAAAAAELAGSFAFTTRSELFLGASPTIVSRTQGQVVGLQRSGAFKVRVTSPSGVGFERIVFPDAVYVRVVGARGEHTWVGSHLKPTVRISTEGGSGGGLEDPLSFLRGLAHSHHARPGGMELVDGRETRHYSLTLPLGALLPPGTSASPALRSILVHIDAWQASDQQLVRAVRNFDIGGPRHLRLTIQTDFKEYGRVAAIKAPPHTPLAGYQPLNSTANDPLGESVLGSLAAGRGHGATPNAAAARVPGVAGAPPAGTGPQP